LKIALELKWEDMFTKDSLIVRRLKVAGESLHKIRVSVSLAYPIAVVSRMLYDVEIRKKWDEYILETRVVDDIKPGTDIIYVAVNTPKGISNRDIVQVREAKYDIEKGIQYILYRSIITDKVPEREGFVRAHTIFSGYELQIDPNNSNHTKLILISQNDAKGSIPKMVLNFVASRSPLQWITIFNKACEKFGSECVVDQAENIFIGVPL